MVRGIRTRMEWLNCEMKLKCLIYTACLIDSDLCRALFGKEAGGRVEANWDDGDVRERERERDEARPGGGQEIKRGQIEPKKRSADRVGLCRGQSGDNGSFALFALFCTSPQGLRNQGHNDLREEHDLFTGRQERGGQKDIKTREGEETRRGIELRGDKTRWSQMKRQETRQEEIKEVRWQEETRNDVKCGKKTT